MLKTTQTEYVTSEAWIMLLVNKLKEFSLLMKDPYLFTHRRYEQTQSRHTKGWLLAVMTHCAYLFVSDNMLHNTLFISSYFPCG